MYKTLRLFVTTNRPPVAVAAAPQQPVPVSVPVPVPVADQLPVLVHNNPPAQRGGLGSLYDADPFRIVDNVRNKLTA